MHTKLEFYRKVLKRDNVYRPHSFIGILYDLKSNFLSDGIIISFFRLLKLLVLGIYRVCKFLITSVLIVPKHIYIKCKTYIYYSEEIKAHERLEFRKKVDEALRQCDNNFIMLCKGLRHNPYSIDPRCEWAYDRFEIGDRVIFRWDRSYHVLEQNGKTTASDIFLDKDFIVTNTKAEKQIVRQDCTLVVPIEIRTSGGLVLYTICNAIGLIKLD